MAAKDEKEESKEEEEEEDEDYVEPMDVSHDDDDDAPSEQQQEETLQKKPRLSAQKRKAVDDAFEELFGYKYGTRFALQPALLQNQKRSRKEYILVDMFGPTAAARLLSQTTTSVVADGGETKPRKYTLPPLQQTKKTVTRVKRFAGTEITVEEKVNDDDDKSGVIGAKKATRASSRRRNKQGGLDHVLNQLEGPSKISTVAKTSADWDKFKTKENLEEELEEKAKGKDAYLVKKDFLNRVDQRRFEHEKSQRDEERAARQK